MVVFFIDIWGFPVLAVFCLRGRWVDRPANLDTLLRRGIPSQHVLCLDYTNLIRRAVAILVVKGMTFRCEDTSGGEMHWLWSFSDSLDESGNSLQKEDDFPLAPRRPLPAIKRNILRSHERAALHSWGYRLWQIAFWDLWRRTMAWPGFLGSK